MLHPVLRLKRKCEVVLVEQPGGVLVPEARPWWFKLGTIMSSYAGPKIENLDLSDVFYVMGDRFTSDAPLTIENVEKGVEIEYCFGFNQRFSSFPEAFKDLYPLNGIEIKSPFSAKRKSFQICGDSVNVQSLYNFDTIQKVIYRNKMLGIAIYLDLFKDYFDYLKSHFEGCDFGLAVLNGDCDE